MTTQINANGYALTANFTVDDIKLLEEENPAALKIYDKEGKNELFSVTYREGEPSIGKYGVIFNAKTRDESGKAIVTGSIPAGADTQKAKDYVAKKIGAAYPFLKQLEASIPAAVEKVKAANKEIIDSITVQ